MRIKGNIEFEVELSAKEACEIAGTITPEESKELREKMLTDSDFKAKVVSSSFDSMFTGLSKMTENLMSLANKK